MLFKIFNPNSFDTAVVNIFNFLGCNDAVVAEYLNCIYYLYFCYVVSYYYILTFISCIGKLECEGEKPNANAFIFVSAYPNSL